MRKGQGLPIRAVAVLILVVVVLGICLVLLSNVNPVGAIEEYQKQIELEKLEEETNNQINDLCPLASRRSGEKINVILKKDYNGEKMEEANIGRGWMCDIPGVHDEPDIGCIITKMERKQNVNDKDGILIDSPNRAYFNFIIYDNEGEKDFEKEFKCVEGKEYNDGWHKYSAVAYIADGMDLKKYSSESSLTLKSYFRDTIEGWMAIDPFQVCDNKEYYPYEYEYHECEFNIYLEYCCPKPEVITDPDTGEEIHKDWHWDDTLEACCVDSECSNFNTECWEAGGVWFYDECWFQDVGYVSCTESCNAVGMTCTNPDWTKVPNSEEEGDPCELHKKLMPMGCDNGCLPTAIGDLSAPYTDFLQLICYYKPDDTDYSCDAITSFERICACE